MELGQKLLSRLFPSRCILCRQTLERDAGQHIEICTHCYLALPHNSPCCAACALPLAEGIDSGVLCGRCLRELPAFDYAHSLFRYEDGVIGLVHQLKFAEKIGYARAIGELLLRKLRETGERPDCLLPVPLHASRMRRRGYNQSIEVSRVIARKSAIPIEYDAVIRHRRTQAQTGLDARQRKKNIRGAFSMVKPLACEHVLIIDDVMTTTATVNELARVLKQNRVRRVGVLCIARAPVKS